MTPPWAVFAGLCTFDLIQLVERVPAVDAVDTTGAGDVFHGAFAYALAVAGLLDEAAFVAALRRAAEVAAVSCRTFGTRDWMRPAG